MLIYRDRAAREDPSPQEPVQYHEDLHHYVVNRLNQSEPLENDFSY